MIQLVIQGSTKWYPVVTGERFVESATTRNMKRREALVMAEKVGLEDAKLENDKAVAMRRDGPRTHASPTLVDPSVILLAVDEFKRYRCRYQY